MPWAQERRPPRYWISRYCSNLCGHWVSTHKYKTHVRANIQGIKRNQIRKSASVQQREPVSCQIPVNKHAVDLHMEMQMQQHDSRQSLDLSKTGKHRARQCCQCIPAQIAAQGYHGWVFHVKAHNWYHLYREASLVLAANERATRVEMLLPLRFLQRQMESRFIG